MTMPQVVVPEMCPRCAPGACARDVPEMCPRCARGVPQVVVPEMCPRCAFCPRCARDVPQVCPRLCPRCAPGVHRQITELPIQINFTFEGPDTCSVVSNFIEFWSLFFNS